MKLTFLGAAREVTGSRFLLEACGKNILIDYGMEQGADVYRNAPLPIAESAVDYVLLTHAHIDHSGWLPLLVKHGFRGKIFSTEATADLCRIMLLDSAHIQESDAEWKNRKAERSGKALVEPLYTQEDALRACECFAPCKYRQAVTVCPGVSATFIDVGHLLGSASIQMELTENGATKTIVFSGDIGNIRQPLIRDPSYLTKADYVVMESTYGDRNHGDAPDYIAALTQTLQSTFDRGGNVVIPSFAVGRTQEMLYFIRQIKEQGLVKGHPGFPVYVDSPLAIEATKVFNNNTMECADEDTMALIRRGINPISFDGLRVAVSAEESKLINDDPTPKVIISASGMCDAGRIRHHLKHNLWRPECTVLFVGYQSNGTLGRSLVDGAKEVKLFGETIQVQAAISKLAGISGHADQKGLLTWISHFSPQPKHVFVVHGEEQTADAFAAMLRSDKGLDAAAPYNGECWSLEPLAKLCEGNHERIVKPNREPAMQELLPGREQPQMQKTQPKAGKFHPFGIRREKQPVSDTYNQLLSAVDRLYAVAEGMKSAGRKEQQKLTNALYKLIKRYNRQ